MYHRFAIAHDEIRASGVEGIDAKYARASDEHFSVRRDDPDQVVHLAKRLEEERRLTVFRQNLETDCALVELQSHLIVRIGEYLKL